MKHSNTPLESGRVLATSALPGWLRGAGAVLAGALVLVALYLTSLRGYLLFHALVELFTIVVAAGVFVIAWNARGYLQNNYLLLVGIASLFVATIDTFHTLAYEGMGVFPGSTANLATQFWIAARSLEAAALVTAPFLIGRRLRPVLALGVFTGITGLLIGSILYGGLFPAAYVDGTGLTAFKVVAEYVIAAAFLAATGLLIRKRDAFAPGVRRLVIAALVLTVAAELAFTQYVSVYGVANLAGHFLRLLASFLLYKAIIETGLRQPFGVLLRELKRSQDRLEEYAAALESANAELRRSEQQLRERAADLAERNQELDTFARTVAHDLKSPVAAIITAASTIASYENLPREQATRLWHRVAATAADLNTIIDNLLLLARVRKEEAPLGPVDMGLVVTLVNRRFDTLIREHEAQVTIAEHWPAVVAYGPWVEEVWANYLTNALKYGGRRPRVELGATPTDSGSVRCWVRDYGPGIPPEAIGRLFVPFSQLGSSRGHGLGLSIVLQIVHKLGGEVGVESEPGEGSTFYFTLPSATSSPPLPAR